MDVNIFIERRKSLKISQVKLCKGICTQSTLSKFENNGKVPSLSILTKLCERLGLSVDDLYKNEIDTTSRLRNLLDRTEKELMMEHYPRVVKNFTEINANEINDIKLTMQFYYLKGLLSALTNGKYEDTFYYFSKILDGLDENHQTIYSYLSYSGLGILYSRIKKIKEANFYFNKVLNYINIHKNEAFPKKSLEMYLRILTILYFTAEYYIKMEDYEKSSELIDMGIKICSEQHMTYYLPRLKLLGAKVAIGENAPHKTIDGLLTESLAFAKINHNEVVELRINALKKQYEARNSIEKNT